jgi:hypothetical protein
MFASVTGGVAKGLFFFVAVAVSSVLFNSVLLGWE